MKILINVSFAVLVLAISVQANAVDNTPKELATRFNKFVAHDGKDKNGTPGFMKIDLECGNVKESIVMNGSAKKPEPVLVVSKPSVFSVNPSIHGGIWPDNVEFDDMTNDNIIGWSYSYKAPNGYIDIIIKNSGIIGTEVKVVSASRDLSSFKSVCQVSKGN